MLDLFTLINLFQHVQMFSFAEPPKWQIQALARKNHETLTEDDLNALIVSAKSNKRCQSLKVDFPLILLPSCPAFTFVNPKSGWSSQRKVVQMVPSLIFPRTQFTSQ